MTTLNQSRQEIEAGIIERASQDPTFRQALVSDPKETLAQFLGTALPEGMKFTVIEEELGHHYLVLPPAPPLLDALPLDDLELALVGGGRTLRPGISQAVLDLGSVGIFDKANELKANTVSSSSC